MRRMYSENQIKRIASSAIKNVVGDEDGYIYVNVYDHLFPSFIELTVKYMDGDEESTCQIDMALDLSGGHLSYSITDTSVDLSMAIDEISFAEGDSYIGIYDENGHAFTNVEVQFYAL